MNTQTKPTKEHWIDLAFRGGESGREDCQKGWHMLAGVMFPPPVTILDVGAGLCLSKRRMGAERVTTQDPAPDMPVDIREDVSQIPDQSYDMVTCFDVIEHVADDIVFLDHLKRIARRYVFITTPNDNVSKARNGCHCREYTPAEFMRLTAGAGRRLWVGDGAGMFPRRLSEEMFLSHFEPHQAAMLDVTRGNLGRWSPWYKHLGPDHPPTSYGVTDAYRLGANYLRDCAMVEDWGCGMGFFASEMRKVSTQAEVVGIDGTSNPHVNKVADLALYTSSVPGAFMRGVIEHDRRWEQILRNFVGSFLQRAVLVLFTPLADHTKEIAFTEELGVPDISFAFSDLVLFFDGLKWSVDTIKSETAYKEETIIYLRRE